MLTWLDPDDVATYAGLQLDDVLLERMTEAAERQVQLLRSDLDWTAAVDRDSVPEGPHIYEGAVMYAALLVQSRNTPDGFSGFDEGGGLIGIGDSAAMTRIYRLLRARKPVLG